MRKFHMTRTHLAMVAIVSLFAVCLGTGAFAGQGQGGTLKTFIGGSYRTLNPAVQSGSGVGVPASQIFAGLVLIDDKYQPTPYLATDWKISEDALIYTFHLVKGATFHDGKPITSEDVAFSLKAVKANHPFGTAMFGNVIAIETPDPLTVIFRLSKPTPGFMLSLQPLLLPILPKHVYDDGKDLKTHPRNMENVVGSGPFIVAENNPSQRLVLRRNPHFFIAGRPYLDQITFEVSKDPLTRMLMLEKGDLEFAPFSGLRPMDVERLAKNPKMHVTSKGYDAIGFVHYLEFNLRKPPFNDLRVRQAFAYAIDVQFIAKVLFRGQAVVGTGPLHTGNPYYTPDVTRYALNLKKAAELLDAAGYKADQSGKRFSITVDVPNWAIQTHVPIAEYLRPQLAKLGIDVTLRRAPDFATWASRISSFDYEATINGSYNYPDPTIGVDRHFLCSNIRNLIWANTEGYCNPKVDELLNAAAVETNQEQRKKLYAEFQRKIVDDLPFFYLVQEPVTTVYRDDVKNVPAGVFGPLAPWNDIQLSRQ